jgi:hypothetical protein
MLESRAPPTPAPARETHVSIRIEFELSYEEWKEALWVYRRTSEATRDNPLQLLRSVGLGATVLGTLLLLKRFDGGGWVAPVALIALGLFIPLRLNELKYAQQKDWWKRIEPFIQPTVWEFDDAAACTMTAQWQATLTWSTFKRWAEGPRVILLFSSDDDFRTFPKRAFASAEQITEFRRLLESRIIARSTGGFPITPTPLIPY